VGNAKVGSWPLATAISAGHAEVEPEKRPSTFRERMDPDAPPLPAVNARPGGHPSCSMIGLKAETPLTYRSAPHRQLPTVAPTIHCLLTYPPTACLPSAYLPAPTAYLPTCPLPACLLPLKCPI
jgi:hypothetical protein